MDGGQALLERDVALARIDQRLRDAIAGAGSLLVLEGPAGIGKTRLVAASRDVAADALLDASFAILHGLYWLSANVGRRTPLLLCADNIHWADQASLRFLHYLGRRLQELPIAVVAAARPAEPAGGSPLLAALVADPSVEVLELAPLSQRAVAELMRLAFGTEVEPAFAAACHEVTGGVPFLVRELIRAIAARASSRRRRPLPASRASRRLRSRTRSCSG